jgi:hypothetical protein
MPAAAKAEPSPVRRKALILIRVGVFSFIYREKTRL